MIKRRSDGWAERKMMERGKGWIEDKHWGEKITLSSDMRDNMSDHYCMSTILRVRATSVLRNLDLEKY